jgi:hypothetical protein
MHAVLADDQIVDSFCEISPNGLSIGYDYGIMLRKSAGEFATIGFGGALT